MGSYNHFQTAINSQTLSPSFKYVSINLKQSFKTPVKKDLVIIILFRT